MTGVELVYGGAHSDDRGGAQGRARSGDRGGVYGRARSAGTRNGSRRSCSHGMTTLQNTKSKLEIPSHSLVWEDASYADSVKDPPTSHQTDKMKTPLEWQLAKRCRKLSSLVLVEKPTDLTLKQKISSVFPSLLVLHQIWSFFGRM